MVLDINIISILEPHPPQKEPGYVVQVYKGPTPGGASGLHVGCGGLLPDPRSMSGLPGRPLPLMASGAWRSFDAHTEREKERERESESESESESEIERERERDMYVCMYAYSCLHVCRHVHIRTHMPGWLPGFGVLLMAERLTTYTYAHSHSSFSLSSRTLTLALKLALSLTTSLTSLCLAISLVTDCGSPSS